MALKTYEVEYRGANDDYLTLTVDGVESTDIQNNTMIFFGPELVVWWIDLKWLRKAVEIGSY